MAIRLSLTGKLILSFAGVALLSALVGGIGWYGTSEQSASIREISTNRMPSVQALLEISQAQMDVDSAENALLCVKLSPELRKGAFDRFDAASKRVDAAWKVYEPLPQTTEEAEEWKKFEPAWKAWWADHEAYVKLVHTYEQTHADADYAALVQQALVTNGKSFDAAAGSLGKLVHLNEQYGQEAATAGLRVSASAQMLIWTATGVALAAGILAGWAIGRGIGKPILTMVDTLSSASAQAASASGQVSSASQGLAQGASEQAAALEETTSALEEMASMTKRSAETAQQASQLAAKAKASADSGNGAMERMTAAITDIEKSASETSKILKVIDEIAFQTNLLALNAAVEAARAGEAGKGFAVVAEEVRALAIRSAEAARNTAALIEQSVGHAKGGVVMASEVAASLGEITTAAGTVNSLIGEIAAASREQSQGIDQVNTAVRQMDQVTQANAANAEESAAAAEELSSQALSLTEIVGQLTRLTTGRAPAGKASIPAHRSTPAPKATRSAPSPAKVLPLNDHEMAGSSAGPDNSLAEFN